MRLKSLEIQGYKSFANKVSLQFDDGITAVVGPNGSGKSNVVDAIRWVLGEQSYSTLRGRKTADMIFSGSENRARMSMAAVNLVFDNTDQWLPLDFSEVSISRRAYRSGENEYYLNHSRVRLRDVSELLAKGGLSRQAYTVIGQGTIDQILSLQAQERRGLFEEAAGITFHRKKRVDTLAKLEQTKENLVRVHDLVQEIAPQLKRLERQAQRATQHRELTQRLAELLWVWYGYQWQQAQQRHQQAEQALHALEAIFKRQQAAQEQVADELSALRQQQNQQRQKMGAWQRERGQLQNQAESLQRTLAVSEERAHQYAAQREEMQADLQLLQSSLATQTEQISGTAHAVEEISAELATTEATLQTLRAQQAEHQAARQALAARQTEAEQEQQKISTALARQQTQRNQVAERRAALQAEQKIHAEEIATLEARRAGLATRQAELAAALATVGEGIDSVEAERTAQRAQLESLAEQAEEIKGRLATLRRREENLTARQDILSRLQNNMEGYHAGVRAVLQGQERLTGIIGPVSQLIQVPPDLEVAIEVALGGRLQNVVVETFADAQAAIEYLKRGQLGRATLLPLETLRVGNSVDPPNIAGVIGLASELVHVAPHLQKLADFALNRTIVVVHLTAGREVFDMLHGGFNIVTRDGELMRSSGAVTGGRSGGRKTEGTFLAREREWRELPGQVAAVAEQAKAVLAELAAVEQRAQAVQQMVAELSTRRRGYFGERDRLQAELEQAGRALGQAENNLQWQQDLQAKAARESEQLQHEEAELAAQIEQLHAEQQTVQAQLAQLKAESDSLAADELLEALEAARLTVSDIRERRQKQQALLESYETMREQLRRQIEGKNQRVAMLAHEREALSTRQQSLQADIGALQTQQGQFTAKIEAAEKELAQREATLNKKEVAEQTGRRTLQKLETELRAASVEAARREDEVQSLTRQVEDELGMVQLELAEYSPEPPETEVELPAASEGLVSVADLPEVTEIPPDLEQELKQVRNKIRRLGNINREAPQEYAQMAERHDFLSTQMHDLEAAATNLREVISKLDAVMEETFAEIFQQVSTEFKRYFKAMFGGGEAKILLTEPDDLTNTGVEIVARPPGKRLQSMALLSGGERSLTAQALIFSLLSVSPSPFVIFDEVDAMLDEANVSRFRDALVGLSQEIQFVIVTHNRRTIEAANTIYGVSMTGDSVSQIFSLKLDEWAEQMSHSSNGTGGP